MRYSEIVNRIVFGVNGRSKNPASLNLIRAMIDAAFPQISSDTAEVYAANDNSRNELRQIKVLTFTADPDNPSVGLATMDDTVLRKYLKDCSLRVTTAVGVPLQKYAYRPEYDDFLNSGDPRLGRWSTNGAIIGATTPATSGSGATALTGAALFICICAPEMPATEDDEFVAPADFLPDFIDAVILFVSNNMVTMTASAKAT